MIIGRREESKNLEHIYQSNEAEFVVCYGRRRVGKTHLIREFFSNKDCLLVHATGQQKGNLTVQLSHFAEALEKSFTHGVKLKTPNSWDDAFKTLTQLIENDNRTTKIVIFLDELPWMATKRSNLLPSLDYYWNHHWSPNPKIILVTCGSSASWLIKNIIYDKGGLHNRATCVLKISPFTLAETAAFLKAQGIQLNQRHILKIYLAIGGIPFYLRYVKPGLSASENIQALFFESKSPLANEFEKLFSSLFENAERFIELIRLISEKRCGLLRSELIKKANLTGYGGQLTNDLQNLIEADFIEVHHPYGKERGEYYKLIDEFCLFYLHWVAAHKNKKFLTDHWLKQQNKPAYHAWAGYAFEAVCHKHVNQIVKGLDLKTAEMASAWRNVSRKNEENGAQIDLLFERGDDAITLCEIKYTDKPFIIDKAYAANLENKMKVFQSKTKTKKQLFLSLISANGIKANDYSKQLISSVATLEDLFV